MNDVVNSAIAGIDNPDMAGTGVVVFDGDQPRADSKCVTGILAGVASMG